MDVFGRITAVLLSIALFFGLPCVYYRMKKEDLTYLYTLQETARFIDRVRDNGGLTEKLYGDYLDRLEAFGPPGQVKLEEEDGWLTVRISNGFVYGGRIRNEDG